MKPKTQSERMLIGLTGSQHLTNETVYKHVKEKGGIKMKVIHRISWLLFFLTINSTSFAQLQVTITANSGFITTVVDNVPGSYGDSNPAIGVVTFSISITGNLFADGTVAEFPSSAGTRILLTNAHFYNYDVVPNIIRVDFTNPAAGVAGGTPWAVHYDGFANNPATGSMTIPSHFVQGFVGPIPGPPFATVSEIGRAHV